MNCGFNRLTAQSLASYKNFMFSSCVRDKTHLLNDRWIVGLRCYSHNPFVKLFILSSRVIKRTGLPQVLLQIVAIVFDLFVLRRECNFCSPLNWQQEIHNNEVSSISSSHRPALCYCVLRTMNRSRATSSCIPSLVRLVYTEPTSHPTSADRRSVQQTSSTSATSSSHWPAAAAANQLS